MNPMNATQQDAIKEHEEKERQEAYNSQFKRLCAIEDKLFSDPQKYKGILSSAIFNILSGYEYEEYESNGQKGSDCPFNKTDKQVNEIFENIKVFMELEDKAQAEKEQTVKDRFKDEKYKYEEQDAMEEDMYDEFDYTD